MGHDELVIQFSALASMIYMMAFTALFDAVVWRHRYPNRRIGYLLAQFCQSPAAW